MSKNPVLMGTQIRMARAALDWSTADLVEKTGLHRNTIYKAEKDASHDSTLQLLRLTFEAAGIVFIAEGETSSRGGAGVRLRK